MRSLNAFAAAVLVVAAGTAGAATLEETFDKTFDVRSGANVALDNTNGRITVRGSNDNRVQIHALKHVEAPNSAAARETLRDLRIDVTASSNGLKVTTHYPRNGGDGFLDWLTGNSVNAGVAYDVEVPHAVNLDVDTVNGRIEIAEVAGELKLDTTNGHIEVSKCRGSLNAETTNGAIKAEMLQVSSGRSIRLNTTNGRITLTVPPSIAASVDAETTNGSINTELPVTTSSHIHRTSLRGTMNGGGPEIKLRTTNGGIEILAAK